MIIAGASTLGQNLYHRVLLLSILILAALLASAPAFAAPGSGKGNQPPVIEEGQVFNLAENVPSPVVVGTVIATSVQNKPKLEYQIVGGDPGGLFAIGLTTGELTTTAPLDHETTDTHLLDVLVVDKFGRSGNGIVTVVVDDVNEAPDAADASFDVSELETVVGTVQASDPDDSLEPFGTLRYQITGGNNGGEFSINSATGDLTAQNLDFETLSSYNLTVQVTDLDGQPGGLSDTASITVTILDGNEPPTASDASFDAPERSPVGSVVGTVAASDPDTSPPFNTLSFAVDGTAFDIDPTTGELFTLTTLDFDETPTYNLTVTVTDGGGLFDTASVTVDVLNAVVPSNISEIDGTNGFALIGDKAGWPVDMVGDMNGDGIDDFVVSASSAEVDGNQFAGSVYVVFGAPGVSPAQINLEDLAEGDGFRFDGENSDENTGELLSAIGDINNDGFADIAFSAFGAFNAENNTQGRVYVVFGGPQFPPVLTATDLELDSSKGFRIINDPLESWGFTPASIGDINGDGIDDFGIDAPNRSFDGSLPQGGEIYAIFGRPNEPDGSSNFGQVLNLASLDPTTGMTVYGATGDSIGLLFGSTGDLNGDGFGDFTVTALGSVARVYVVFGNVDLSSQPANVPPNSLSLGDLNGTNGFVIDGDVGGFLGGTGGGDINGDGYSDAVIAAPGESNLNGETEAGALYVIFGGPGIDWANFNLASLGGPNPDDPGGFKIVGAAASDAFGYPADNRSDLDGDGFADIVVGTRIAVVPQIPLPPPEPTPYYLIAGSGEPFPALIDLNSLDPSVGNTIEADPRTEGMSAGGDVNGDGNDDFILSGGLTGGVQNVGPAHVVFGGDF